MADGMSRLRARERCARYIAALRVQAKVRIVEADPTLFWRGFELYQGRADKEWSLTDCTSLVVMAEEALSDALTGDRHSEQAGFTALLLPAAAR